MIRKSRSPIADHIRVVFELPSCVWADRIFLTGDFNDWRENDIRLHQNRNGVWQAVLDLPAGRSYQFRYLIDGQWRTDSHADGFADNGYGAQNSIVITELAEPDELQAHNGLVHDSRPVRPFTVPTASKRAQLRVG